MNSIDIMYYDNMMDLISENRKINEAIMIPTFHESEVALYEAKIVESILNFFKTLFEKVIQFFKKIINVVSDNKNFTQ